jgi:hypothetical protein
LDPTCCWARLIKLSIAKHLGRNRVISADTLLADISKLHGRKSGE